ncbi:hypothetical protein QYF61_022246 [Mycteria americana]|uniref:Uncharacterized protein n=1 Tax=Mycteria americana TaxID=33587 RepID=A0AAN7NX34_MYCAM|nr:hypothetical protein QYF61_022246 [Mycteria americana]
MGTQKTGFQLVMFSAYPLHEDVSDIFGYHKMSHPLHEVHMGSLLKPVKVPLDGIPSLKHISYTTELGAICKFAEGALNPTVYVINKDIEQYLSQRTTILAEGFSHALCTPFSFLRRYRTLHFPLLNFMTFLIAHFSSPLRLLWVAAQHFGVSAAPPRFVSSANLPKVHSALSCRPLITMLKRIGSSMDPCDRPPVTSLQLDFVSLSWGLGLEEFWLLL